MDVGQLWSNSPVFGPDQVGRAAGRSVAQATSHLLASGSRDGGGVCGRARSAQLALNPASKKTRVGPSSLPKLPGVAARLAGGAGVQGLAAARGRGRDDAGGHGGPRLRPRRGRPVGELAVRRRAGRRRLHAQAHGQGAAPGRRVIRKIDSLFGPLSMRTLSSPPLRWRTVGRPSWDPWRSGAALSGRRLARSVGLPPVSVGGGSRRAVARSIVLEARRLCVFPQPSLARSALFCAALGPPLGSRATRRSRGHSAASGGRAAPRLLRRTRLDICRLAAAAGHFLAPRVRFPLRGAFSRHSPSARPDISRRSSTRICRRSSYSVVESDR